MKVITNFEEIDKESWSNFVKNHKQGNIFQTPQFHQIFSEVKNYNPSIICVVSKKQILGILSSVVQWSNSKYLDSLSYRSILMGAPLINSKNHKMVLEVLIKAYQKNLDKKVLYSQIRNLYLRTDIKEKLQSLGFEYLNHVNYILDLGEGEEKIWKGMNKKRRNSIKKSLKSGSIIKEVVTEKEVINSYNILKTVYSRSKMPLADLSLFLSSFNILREKGSLVIFNSLYNNKVIATLWLLKYNDSYYDWYSGSDSNFSSLNPNDSLIWHGIKDAISNNFSSFDFGGAGSPDKSYGVRDFKKKFGGEEVFYGRFQKNHKPILYGPIMYLFEKYRLFPIKFK